MWIQENTCEFKKNTNYTLKSKKNVARCLIKVQETGRWAHINVKLLHLFIQQCSWTYVLLCDLYLKSVHKSSLFSRSVVLNKYVAHYALQMFISFLGTRIRKQYFLIKDKAQPKEKFILSWVCIQILSAWMLRVEKQWWRKTFSGLPSIYLDHMQNGFCIQCLKP